MYEDVLDDSALQAMWDEHPEAFQVDALQAEIDRLRGELDEARRQLSADPVQEAVDSEEYVCLMLGRACLEEGCSWYLSFGEGDEGCAMFMLAESHKNVQISTRNIASCM